MYYSCPSCGAEIVTDATTAATFCYYCHNPVVLGKRLEGTYLPNKIIPFEISREEAEKKFLDFVGKKPGRGAYLCPDGACLARARKTKALERAFETAIPAEIYEALLAQREAANGT